MEPQFWQQRWELNELGFQLDAAHPLLCAQLAAMPQQSKVFVPLCGKSPDMHALASRYQVIGAELAEIACRDFFAEAGLTASTSSFGLHQLWQSGVYQLWQGDFFALPLEAVAGTELIYDRAALIALPPQMRLQYAAKLQQLFQKAKMLLITLEYPEGEKQGPPFAVFADELPLLFPNASIQLAGIRNLTGQGFARRKFSTSQLVEKSWWICW
ncbi:thiopurine S-methyltransferase [Rheinheimera sp. 4Y26]|uniref:thiopurine S-methyltransferase n=1 Tax=Rheinheimera sp. 4Y26 TaxID=2977811 RepID=UPI0021B1102C|nr:thiopurine S-methyltransferase [Rheinheimera sp. 4Y26]MCT6699585.1 thiopurine S-methyltransferase [Rheinheimera sp. 4Y26]